VSGDVIGLVSLTITLSIHLITTVWWAASITKRVEHAEKWMASHEHTAERLAMLEQQLENAVGALDRIEHILRNH
jgi:hypothetical protein